MPPLFPKYNDGPCANEQALYFRATAETAELTLSDVHPTAGIKAGNYINAPFETPNPKDVNCIMFNFIQIQPVLSPEKWNLNP